MGSPWEWQVRTRAGAARASRERFRILGTESSASELLKAHWRNPVAAGLLTVEVWNLRGPITHYILFFIEIPTRAVRIAWITTSRAEAWMLRIARDACGADDGGLSEGRKLLINRNARYSCDWHKFTLEQGVEVIRLPPRSNLNAYAERFVRAIKDECLDRLIFIGQASMRRAAREVMAQYHAERNHQGLGNRPIGAQQASIPSSERAEPSRLTGKNGSTIPAQVTQFAFGQNASVPFGQMRSPCRNP